MRQILCFGDSNTYGLVPGTSERFEWGVRWTSILDERVRGKGYRVIEEGLCGRTTVFDDTYRKGRRGTDLLPVLLEAHAPLDIIILMLGTNDCKTAYGATAEQIGEGMEQLLNQIQTFYPQIQIVLISPILLGDRVWEEGYDTEFDEKSVAVSKKLSAVYERIAEKRGIAFLAASDCAKSSSIDREHMDAENHKFFAEAVSQKIESLIESNTMEKSSRITFYEEYAS